jgi:hypothetical protein
MHYNIGDEIKVSDVNISKMMLKVELVISPGAPGIIVGESEKRVHVAFKLTEYLSIYVWIKKELLE